MIDPAEDSLEHAIFWIDYYDPTPAPGIPYDYLTTAVVHFSREKLRIAPSWDGQIHSYVRKVAVGKGFLRAKETAYQVYVGSGADQNFVFPTPMEAHLAAHKSMVIMADAISSGKTSLAPQFLDKPWPDKGVRQFTIRTFFPDLLPSWDPEADAYLAQTIHFTPVLRMRPVVVSIEKIDSRSEEKWVVRIGEVREELLHDDWVAAFVRCLIASYAYARQRVDQVLVGLR